MGSTAQSSPPRRPTTTTRDIIVNVPSLVIFELASIRLLLPGRAVVQSTFSCRYCEPLFFLSTTPCQKYKPWFASNTNMTGMDTFSASNTPTITPLSWRQASLPMKYTSDAYRAPPSPSLVALTLEPISALTATILPIATLPENGNSTPTSSCMNSTLLQSLV